MLYPRIPKSESALDGPQSERMGLDTSRFLRWLLLFVVLIGLVARLSPLFDMQGRLFWQYMTEDGYLLQTVARNMAIGLGMSTAEGTMPTNGVQPLVTFLFAGLHWLAGGARLESIALVTLVSVLISGAAAWYLYRVGCRVLGSLSYGHELAATVAALWLVAPLIMRHSMNGLETGLYYLAILFTLNEYLRLAADGNQRLTASQRTWLGVLLGITFLARNDAVFFIAGLLFAHAALGGAVSNGGNTRRIVDGVWAGAVSVLVALPWLINNYKLFGSIVPISGTSQSHAATFGQNLSKIPANLFESAYLFAPIPGSLEAKPLVVLLAALAVLASLGGFWFSVARLTLAARRFYVAGLLFLIGVSLYYGLLFGAPHFLSRYTSSSGPFLWLSTCVMVTFLATRLPIGDIAKRRMATALVLLLALMGTAFAVNDFRKGTQHMHKQVVDWVQQNVAPAVWVGAVQTGTLGYFHDRTINLDGKVNPDALRVLLREGHILNYVLDSKIDYVADWVGMADWVNLQYAPRFGREFEVVVKDEPHNLAVLRRIDRRSK